MRVALASAAVLSLVLALPTGILSAAPAPQDQLYQITSPRPNAEVRGSVEIVGSARLPEFDFYKLQYASSATSDLWIDIGDVQRQEKTNERLGIWHTTALPDGAYYLRLMVVKKDGNHAETDALRVNVANAEPAPTPTPEESPTPTATVVIPTPTTAIVEQPTTIGATPTPVVEAEASLTAVPDNGATVSIPSLGACARQFVFGAFVAAVLFVFAAVVFLLRRFI